MAISDYSSLQAAIGKWLNRTDMAANIPDFIRLAEATLNKVLRDTHMVASAPIAVASPWRSGVGPVDMLAPIYVQIAGAVSEPLEQIAPEQLVSVRRRMQAAGTPSFYCLMGRNFEVCPSPPANLTLDLTYYRRIPPLTDGSPSNWLLENDPDLYLYTALLHAAPFLQDNARTELFGALVAQTVTLLVQANKTATLDTIRQPGWSLNPPTNPARPAQ